MFNADVGLPAAAAASAGATAVPSAAAAASAGSTAVPSAACVVPETNRNCGLIVYPIVAESQPQTDRQIPRMTFEMPYEDLRLLLVRYRRRSSNPCNDRLPAAGAAADAAAVAASDVAAHASAVGAPSKVGVQPLQCAAQLRAPLTKILIDACRPYTRGS